MLPSRSVGWPVSRAGCKIIFWREKMEFSDLDKSKNEGVETQAFGEDDDGGIIIFTKPVEAVIFEHKNHLDQGLECDSCHDDLFEMETGVAEGNDDFTMASLYEGKYCGASHAGDMTFASNARCTVCVI